MIGDMDNIGTVILSTHLLTKMKNRSPEKGEVTLIPPSLLWVWNMETTHENITEKGME